MEVASFLAGNIATLANTLSAMGHGNVRQGRYTLTRKDKGSRPVNTFHGGGKCAGGFLRIGRPDDIEIWDAPKGTCCLDRLVSGTILSDAD